MLAPVAAGIGFTLLTPTLPIDGLAEGMEVKTRKLPIAGLGVDSLSKSSSSIAANFRPNTPAVPYSSHAKKPGRSAVRDR